MLSISISRSSNLPPSLIAPPQFPGSLGLSVHHACNLTCQGGTSPRQSGFDEGEISPGMSTHSLIRDREP